MSRTPKVTHPVEWPTPSQAAKPARASNAKPKKGARGFARWTREAHHAASVRGGKGLVASGKQHKIQRGKEAREVGRLGGLARARNAGQRIHKG